MSRQSSSMPQKEPSTVTPHLLLEYLQGVRETTPITNFRHHIGDYTEALTPVVVTNRDHSYGLWVPLAGIDLDGEKKTKRAAYDRLNDKMDVIKSLIDPEDSLRAVQEIEELRNAEGFIE